MMVLINDLNVSANESIFSSYGMPNDVYELQSRR